MPSMRKNCCVSGASGAEPHISARRCGPKRSLILLKMSLRPSASQNTSMARARLCKEKPDQSGALSEGVFYAATHALEECGHVEKIVRSGEANFVRKFREIGGKRENTLAREAGEQENPRGREIEWRIVEDAVGLAGLAHELVQALGRAGKHVSEVAGGKADALWFAGGARGVDDGDGGGIAMGISSVGN